jgi:urocanate hydratase
MLTSTDLQRQTLRLYGELLARRETWGGQLVFTSGEGSSASGLPAAVSIAGGTTLALDPDAATVKAVFRQGGIDFVVNTLDEALRVLKNEIRQHKPLSVGLISPLQPVLDEMAERGVLPDLSIHLQSSNLQGYAHAIDFQSKGHGFSRAMETPEVERASAPEEEPPLLALAPWLEARNWSEIILPAESTSELRALDLRILEVLPAEDTLRRRWLQRISHYQRPSTTPARVLWLTPAEAANLKISTKTVF